MTKHDRDRDLQTAQPNKLSAQPPQAAGVEFKTDNEQHHHDAKLREVLDRDDIHTE